MIATDGCLIASARIVVATSKDRGFLEKLQAALGGCGWIRGKISGFGTLGYDLVIKRKALYDRLIALGLTPRKSLTIGALNVPDHGFRDFLRGVIDGDGNIRRWVHPTNGCEQWAIRISSASKAFPEWLRSRAEQLWQLRGSISETRRDGRSNSIFVLKYGKLAAKAVLERCYYSGSFALDRKQRLAEACAVTSVGWAKSKTVLDRASWKGWKYAHVWENRVMNITNPNVDPTSGLVKESDGSWAGVSERETIGA